MNYTRAISPLATRKCCLSFTPPPPPIITLIIIKCIRFGSYIRDSNFQQMNICSWFLVYFIISFVPSVFDVRCEFTSSCFALPYVLHADMNTSIHWILCEYSKCRRPNNAKFILCNLRHHWLYASGKKSTNTSISLHIGAHSAQWLTHQKPPILYYICIKFRVLCACIKKMFDVGFWVSVVGCGWTILNTLKCLAAHLISLACLRTELFYLIHTNTHTHTHTPDRIDVSQCESFWARMN